MNEQQILNLYHNRQESAVAETQRAYGDLCQSVAYRILENRQDAEEVVNDAYVRLWNAIPPARPNSLKAYLLRTCRNLALTRLDARKAQKRGDGALSAVLDELSECIPDRSAEYDAVLLKDVLTRFLRSLPSRTRNVFLRRYWFASPVSEIAEEFSMSEEAVRVLTFRTRNKLKEFLEKEGFFA